MREVYRELLSHGICAGSVRPPPTTVGSQPRWITRRRVQRVRRQLADDPLSLWPAGGDTESRAHLSASVPPPPYQGHAEQQRETDRPCVAEFVTAPSLAAATTPNDDTASQQQTVLLEAAGSTELVNQVSQAARRRAERPGSHSARRRPVVNRPSGSSARLGVRLEDLFSFALGPAGHFHHAVEDGAILEDDVGCHHRAGDVRRAAQFDPVGRRHVA